MNPAWSFATGLALTAVISTFIVGYLRRPLERLLADLCGNHERAVFWTAFSAVTVGVVPIIFALSHDPTANSSSPLFLQIAEQLKWGLIGVVASVLMLGWMVGRFIPRPSPKQ